jgi:flagellar hook-basal body complex protein FliE
MVGPVVPITTPTPVEPVRPSGRSEPGAFQEALSAAIRGVEASRKNAATSVERFLSGEGEELHTTIMAAQRAELAFEMFLQARNKVVSAYQEIMRMQV